MQTYPSVQCEKNLLSVIVPVYNEEPNLREVVDFLMKSPCPVKREWIFVDDCSTDQSLRILRELANQYEMQILAQPQNQGKGAAVIRGFEQAKGEYIMIQDADFEYNPYDVPKLLEPLIQGEADVVYGSRFKRSAAQVHRTYHFFVNRLLTLLSNLLSGVYLTDMETCYKIFRADLLKSMNLRSFRFGIEVELTAYIAKVRARIFELPISYYPRTQLQGKKINWKDGVAALKHLITFNWFVSFSEAFKPTLPARYHPEMAAQLGPDALRKPSQLVGSPDSVRSEMVKSHQPLKSGDLEKTQC
jgi:glycosyltransferase involved in cell wall biosynthesis